MLPRPFRKGEWLQRVDDPSIVFQAKYTMPTDVFKKSRHRLRFVHITPIDVPEKDVDHEDFTGFVNVYKGANGLAVGGQGKVYPDRMEADIHAGPNRVARLMVIEGVYE